MAPVPQVRFQSGSGAAPERSAWCVSAAGRSVCWKMLNGQEAELPESEGTKLTWRSPVAAPEGLTPPHYALSAYYVTQTRDTDSPPYASVSSLENGANNSTCLTVLL